MSMPDALQVDNRPLKRGRLLVQSMSVDDVDASVPSSAASAYCSPLKKTRGKRAALNNFIEMPFDILFEVCIKSEVVNFDANHLNALDSWTPSPF
jgi:hypothetical protein